MIRGVSDINLVYMNEPTINDTISDIKMSDIVNDKSITYNMCSFLIALVIFTKLSILCYMKFQDKNMVEFMLDKYKEWRKERTMVLPFTQPNKAKQSPFIVPALHTVLPVCSTLDDSEKGNMRNRSLTVSRVLHKEPVTIQTETRVTIFRIAETAVSPKTELIPNFNQDV